MMRAAMKAFLPVAIFLVARAASAQSFIEVNSGADQNLSACATTDPCSLRAAVQALNTNTQVCGCAIQTTSPPRAFSGDEIFIDAAASPVMLTGAAQENTNANGDIDIAFTGGTCTVTIARRALRLAR